MWIFKRKHRHSTAIAYEITTTQRLVMCECGAVLRGIPTTFGEVRVAEVDQMTNEDELALVSSFNKLGFGMWEKSPGVYGYVRNGYLEEKNAN